MKGKLVFCTLSSLFGIISVFEGIWAVGLFLLYLYCLWGIKKIPNKQIFSLLTIYLLYLFVSYFSLINNKTSLPPIKTKFLIQFSDEAKVDGNQFRAVVLDTEMEEKLILSYKIPSHFEKKFLQQNQMIKKVCMVTGKLEQPSTSRNQHAFNYKEYLKQKRIFWELKVTNWEFGSCKNGRLNLLDKIRLLRLTGLSLIEKNFSKETAPLAAALIFGSRELLAEETVTSYQKLGVIHLISISGLHVALLVSLIFYLGIRAGMVREKLSSTLVMILPVYAILTGATPPVNRAVIMTMMILVVTSLKFPIKLRSIDGLCVSFLFLSIQNPIIIYNIGFQLSYIVTLSLLLSLSIVTKYQSNLSKMMITSYISQASALPFLLYHFYEIPLFSLIANVLYIPLYSFIFLPGLILLFLLQFLSNELFQFLTLLLSYLIGMSDRLAGIFSSILWTRSIPGKPSLLFLILYTISILVSFYEWGKSLRLRLSLTLPWIVLSAHLLSPFLSPEGEVTVIDVGQGDSIFIKLPYNRGNYLIDTGGNIVFPEVEWKRRKNKYDVGQDVLVPFLKSKGVRSLDLLIITHGDLDHIGGSFSLLNELKVKKIVLPSVLEKSIPEKKLVRLAETKNIAVSYVYEGVAWKMKNSEFFVLSPPSKYIGEKNDGSIVLYARLGGVNWLFTGDLGKEGEKHLIEKYPKLAFDILKVGHHGSKTSTSAEFIQHFRPKYSIISVGEKNGFGHPHSDVLNNLKAGGSEILRTDIHGGITFYFRGERGTFYKSIP